LFTPWDKFGYEFLTKDLSTIPAVMNGTETVAYNFGLANHTLLKLFFLSVLWRAHSSTHAFFRKVQLGPFADRAKELLLAGNAGGDDDFPVLLSRFDQPPNVVGMLQPIRTTYERVNHYRLSFGGYVAIIKVANKKRPACFEGLYLSEGNDVIVINREFRESKEFLALAKLAINNRKRRDRIIR
jgi:hypothetical protein